MKSFVWENSIGLAPRERIVLYVLVTVIFPIQRDIPGWEGRQKKHVFSRMWQDSEENAVFAAFPL